MTIIRAAMASRMRIMGSLKVSLNSAQKVVGSESGLTLDPYFRRHSSTCLSVSPLECMIATPTRCGKGACVQQAPPAVQILNILFPSDRRSHIAPGQLHQAGSRSGL